MLKGPFFWLEVSYFACRVNFDQDKKMCARFYVFHNSKVIAGGVLPQWKAQNAKMAHLEAKGLISYMQA